jgi:hypothetical protein
LRVCASISARWPPLSPWTTRYFQCLGLVDARDEGFPLFQFRTLPFRSSRTSEGISSASFSLDHLSKVALAGPPLLFIRGRGAIKELAISLSEPNTFSEEASFVMMLRLLYDDNSISTGPHSRTAKDLLTNPSRSPGLVVPECPILDDLEKLYPFVEKIVCA